MSKKLPNMSECVLFRTCSEKIDTAPFFFLQNYGHSVAEGLARLSHPLTLLAKRLLSGKREQAYPSALHRQASCFFHPLQFQTCGYA